jgi:hypothetical protein
MSDRLGTIHSPYLKDTFVLDSFGNSLSALVAVGGNSRAARSARAKLQWRDRFGRFIEMGRGIKFKVRLSDGTARSVNGKFVGAVDGETGQVYVQNDPSGLKDGFYNVKSNNAQEILASLDDAALAKRGITLGKDSGGNPVSDRADEDIPNAEEIPFADAPTGWSRKEDKAGAQVWETEDGDYRMYHAYKFVAGKQVEQWGIEDVRRAPGKMKNWRDIGFALKQVDNNDKLPEPDGLDNEQRVANLKDENAAQRVQLESLNDPAVPLKQRLSGFDPQGKVAGLIDSGASGDDILDALRENAAWNEAENDLNHPADLPSADQKHRDGVYSKLKSEVVAYQKGDIPAEAQSEETSGSAPVDGAGADLDTDTFGVAKTGFLVPAGKTTTDGSAEGVAAFVTANKDFLGEGGKRLIVDVGPDGTITQVDIANSAPTIDDAKAQAGGIGAPEFYDVVANATVSNDKNLNPTQETPNGQDGSSNSGEPVADDARPDQPVDGGNSPEGAERAEPAPAAGDSAPEPASDALGQPIPADRAGLEQRVAYLNRAVGRVSPESPRFDDTFKAQKGVQDALDNFKDPEVESPETSPKEDVTPEVAPESTNPDSGAPKDDKRIADLEKVVADLQADKTNSDILEKLDDIEKAVSAKTDTAPTPDSPAPAEPAQDNTPEVPNAPESVPEVAPATPALPTPDTMSWDDLNAELRNPVDPMSPTLGDDLKRYDAVQAEFFNNRGGFGGRPVNADATPASVPPAETTARPEAPATPAATVDAPEVAPEPSDEGDGLPDNLADLEDMAGAMEREIAGARPARQRILREQVDKVYDKMDALAPPIEPTPEVAPESEPANVPEVDAPDIAPVDVPDTRTDAEVQTRSAALINTAAGKDLAPEDQAQLDRIDALEAADLAQLAAAINIAPNRANTVTRPRDPSRNPEALSPASPNLVAIEANPDEIVDPNLIMADVRKNHPNHNELSNGDLVIESVDKNGKTYDLVVRRTARERFFAYILETDQDGNQRASRLQVETHSYAALQTKIGRGKAILRTQPDIGKWMNRRQNKENIGQNGLQDNAAESYINGTVIPRSEDQAYNQLVEGIAALAVQDGAQRHFLDALAMVGGQKPEFVDMILESINNRKLLDAAGKIGGTKESHLSADGDKLAPGQWIDWTDDKKTRPVKDEFGNTVYERDAEGRFVLRPNGQKIAVNEPNPDYGKVFRGQVKALRYKTNDGKYVYSDSTYVAFPELNARAGRNAQRQVARIGSQLKIVDGPDAPKNDPFFARKEEKRNQENVAGDFGLPNASAADSVRAPARPAPSAPSVVYAELNLNNGDLRVAGFPDVAVPFDHIDAAREVQDREAVSKRASELVPGDYIVGQDDNNGAPIYDKVLAVSPNGDGRTRVQAVRIDEEDYLLRDRIYPPNKLTVFPEPPAAEAVASPDLNKPVADWEIGNNVAVPGVPGNVGKIENIMPGIDGNATDALYKIRGGEDGEVYWVEGSEVAQFGQTADVEPLDPNAPAWHNDPATEKQIDALKRFIGGRVMNVAERGRLREAVANPNLTKKQASDLMGEFAPRKKRNAHSDNLDELLARLEEANNIPMLDGIKARMEQDRADEHAPDIYGNELVKKLEWKDIKPAQFTNLRKANTSELQIGDLVPYGVGVDRYYLQIVAPGVGGDFRVRAIGQRPGQIMRPNGRQMVHGDVGVRYIYNSKNVKRPNEKVAKNYFADPAMMPVPLPARAAQFALELPEPEDPKMVDRMNERGQKLVDAYINGHTVIGGANAGADAERADIIEVSGGKRYFVKGIKAGGAMNFLGQRVANWDGDQQMKNEVIANRIAQALGIDDIQMAQHVEDNGDRLVIMDLVDGDIALNKPNQAQEIQRNMWDYPNAWRIGIMDEIIVNRDRHDGNWMINAKGQPVPIDHGRISFEHGKTPYSAFAAKLIRDIENGSAPITTAELMRLKSNLNMLRSEFASMGMTKEFIVMMEKMTSLIGKAKK